MAQSNLLVYGGNGFHEASLYPFSSIKKRLPARNYNTTKVNFNPDGSMVAVSFNSASIAIYDTETWQVITPHGAEIFGQSGRWSPDGTLYAIAGGSSDEPIKVFDTTVEPWAQITGLPAITESSPITAVAISPDNKYIAITCSSAPFLYVINLETKTVESVTTGLSYAQSDADFSPDGTLLAVSGSAPRFSVYEVPTWQKRNISATYNSDTCRFSPDGSILAVGYSSGKGLCFYNPSTGAISEPINVGKSVRQISWSSDGALLALACYNGGVRVYDYASGTLLDTPNTASMNAVGLSPAVSVPSRKVKTVHHDGGDAAVTIRVHDPETGAVIGEVASSGSAEVMLLEPASVWLAAKDDRVGGRDKIIASEVSIPAGAEPPIVMSLDYLGATVTISSNLTTQAGAPGDEVVIRNWTTRELVAKVVPDANGDWIAEVPPGTYDVSYIAENCAPVIHGPYTIELP